MKMTKKQLEELVDKTGALVGSKSTSPKYGNSLVGSYDVTDDHVEKTTQDRSYETPYRRYFGEDDLSNHPLFDISKKAKNYNQFIEMSKKYKPKMDDDELKDAAGLFGFRKEKKRIVKEKEINENYNIDLEDVKYFRRIMSDKESTERAINRLGLTKYKKLILATARQHWVLGDGKDSKFPESDYSSLIDEILIDYGLINENAQTLLSRIVKNKKVNEGILRFNDGISINTSGKLRSLELHDGWYVVGEGKLIPVKDEEAADMLIKKMTEKPIEENVNNLLEKIVKIKTKDDVFPKMIKSNNHIDKAISHLKGSIDEIEKYKTNPKVSGVYRSIENTIKSLESIVDKIEDKTDLMDSINENTLPFDEEIKRELRKLYSGSIYDKVGKIDDRIEQLFSIHNKWLDMAKKTYSSDVIADKLFKYEKNLKNG